MAGEVAAAGVPGLPERLAAGGTVADVAAGAGDAAALVATAFPQARVYAYDIVDGARDDLPDNVRFGQADASSMPYDGPFDLVYILDPFITLAIRIWFSLAYGAISPQAGR